MENNPDQMVQDDTTPRKRKRSPISDLHPITDRNTRIQGNVISRTSEETAVQSSSKRLREQSGSSNGTEDLTRASQVKRTHAFSLADLPVEILQRVLCYMDPFCLGRMMCVNKHFYSLLDPHQELDGASASQTHPRLLRPDKIWSCSRKAYLPSTPYPLASMTELDMMKLIYGKHCQKCGNSPKASSSNVMATPWNSGPGPTGVRTIWPFRTRLCANCLRPSLLKESELNHSGSSQLQVGLLPASFTPSLNYVMSIILTQTPVPAGLQLTRYYYQPQLEGLLQSALEPLVTGSPDHERWSESLDVMRRRGVEDTVRLEAWELSQKAANDMLTIPSNTRFRSSASGSSVQSDNLTKSYFSTSSGGQKPYTALSSRSGIGSSLMSGNLSRNDAGAQNYLTRTGEHIIFPSHSAIARSAIAVPQFHATKDAHHTAPDQGSVDVVRLKAERRAEIQTRCMALNPPIMPQILERLPAFQSAIQSLMPLDDATWDRLKTQLEDQMRRSEAPGVPTLNFAPSPDYMDTASLYRVPTPATEPLVVDFEQQALRPVREKLYEFAREHVHRRYADGTNLTYSTAPQFAADVLVYVRQRFYENQRLEDAAFRIHNQKPPDEGPSGIRARALKLEHMRYVFDTSIKPFTELVRKDLFLCSACDTQGRYFAFEAIIQHFASKHTDLFSRGTAVVYWKAHWPLQPPFEQNPGSDADPVTELVNSLTAPGVSASIAAQASTHPAVSQYDNHIPHDDGGASSASRFSGSMSQATNIDLAITSDSQRSVAASRFPYDRLEQRLERVERDTNVDRSYRGVEPAIREDHSVSHPTTSFLEAHQPGSRHRRRNVLPAAYDFRHQTGTGVDVQMTGGDVQHTEGRTRPRPIQSARSLYHHQQPSASAEASEMQRGRSYESNRYDRYGNIGSSFQPESNAPSHRRAILHDTPQYSSPRHQAMAPVEHQDVDRDLHWAQPVEDVPSSDHDTAERFLASFDVPVVRPVVSEDSVHSAKPASTGHLSRPASRNDLYGRDALSGRQSNTSQYRSRTQVSQGAASQIPADMPAEYGNQALGRQPSFSGPSPSHQVTRYYSELAPIDQASHPRDRTARQLEELQSSYDNRRAMTNERGYEEVYYDFSRRQYLDQHGRRIDIHNLEIVRNPSNYQEVREVLRESPYYHDEISQSVDRRNQPQYEQELVYHPTDRSSYVEGPMREYPPRPRFVEYERSTGAGIVYEEDSRYYQANHTQRRPDDGRYQRYERP